MSSEALDRPERNPPLAGYRALPFRFTPFDGRYLLVNDAGEHLFLDHADFSAFVEHRLDRNAAAYLDLKGKHFLADTGSALTLRLLATKYRTKRACYAGFTRLHIFVLTLRCDHSCLYCQVSRVVPETRQYDMSRETADRALDYVFRVPAREVKIEFQGGEPLLNFPMLRYVVEQAEDRNRARGKLIEFVVCSNLAALTDEMLEFLRAHHVFVSTSLDGPPAIHNANRPRHDRDSYERAIEGIERVRQALGPEAVSALMTTSRLALAAPEEIVDEYVAQAFRQIFVRPVSPYGFALRARKAMAYAAEEFVEFYKRALDRVIEHNRKGTFLVESYAQLLLTRILTPFTTGYVDLQSPCGGTIGTVVYNYDGSVYSCDEGRMLAEMGDRRFRLGSVFENTYEEIFGGELPRAMAAASCIEAAPGCVDCTYQPFCGTCPVENYSKSGDLFGRQPDSESCQRNKAIMEHLLRLYHGTDSFIPTMFWSWIQNTPSSALIPEIPA